MGMMRTLASFFILGVVKHKVRNELTTLGHYGLLIIDSQRKIR